MKKVLLLALCMVHFGLFAEEAEKDHSKDLPIEIVNLLDTLTLFQECLEFSLKEKFVSFAKDFIKDMGPLYQDEYQDEGEVEVAITQDLGFVLNLVDKTFHEKGDCSKAVEYIERTHEGIKDMVDNEDIS